MKEKKTEKKLGEEVDVMESSFLDSLRYKQVHFDILYIYNMFCLNSAQRERERESFA